MKGRAACGPARGLRTSTCARRSGSGLFEAVREFREIQQWVEENRFRFKSDVPSLVAHWEMPE